MHFPKASFVEHVRCSLPFLEEPLFEDKTVIWGKLLEHKSYDNLPLHAHLCSISAANLWETISIFKRTEVSLCLLNFYIKILHTYYRSFERNRKIGMQRKDYSAYIITIHVGIFL